MLKSFIFILIIQSGMMGGCGMVKQNDESKMKIDKVILNGNVLDIGEDKKNELSDFILNLLIDSDDYYELLVTDELIRSIREEESFVEVIFNEKQEIKTDKFGVQMVTGILIPLSGKFASNDQVVFFSGLNDFSNTPLINSNGRSELMDLIEKIK